MFRIHVRRVEEHTFILHLKGELTASSSLALHRTLDPILERRPRAVSINLSDVETMDEAGLSTVMNGIMAAPSQGTYFYLIGLPEKVEEVYRLRSQQGGPGLVSGRTH